MLAMNSYSFNNSSNNTNEVNIKLETHAERHIGKEISLVNDKDLNHLDLVIEAKNNRLKQEYFYIYDYDKFNDCSLIKPNFNILNAKEQINHKSTRYVIHYLTKELKQRFKTFNNKQMDSFYEIFKPSLGQFNDDDIKVANQFLRSLFPFEGCSYTGEKLEKMISKVSYITLILTLRIIWSLLPGAILSWESFKKFQSFEKSNNYQNYESFYHDLPKFLQSHNHGCVLFEFLEILLAIFTSDEYFLDLNNSIDLIFTAGQICFNRDELDKENTHTKQNDPLDESCDDLNKLQEFYYKRGYSFYQIFKSYLRSLSKEQSFNNTFLLDIFKIDEYPPKAYKPVTQKALTLKIPFDEENFNDINYFKLISNASNSSRRIYSSNYTFTKFENKFLDKFEFNPYKIVDCFFSNSSKNYLLKFDKNLDFKDFKDLKHDSNHANNHNSKLPNQNPFLKDSTFIKEFNRYGFNLNNLNSSNEFFKSEHPFGREDNDSMVNIDTINLNFNSNLNKASDEVDNPVRISKLDITEWFINAWKYETFLGLLQNTVVIKLTKTIGDCDWLIITADDKVSTTNRYLTPLQTCFDSEDFMRNDEDYDKLKQQEQQQQEDQKKKSPKLKLPCKLSPKKKITKDDITIAYPSPPKEKSVESFTASPDAEQQKDQHEDELKEELEKVLEKELEEEVDNPEVAPIEVTLASDGSQPLSDGSVKSPEVSNNEVGNAEQISNEVEQEFKTPVNQVIPEFEAPGLKVAKAPQAKHRKAVKKLKSPPPNSPLPPLPSSPASVRQHPYKQLNRKSPPRTFTNPALPPSNTKPQSPKSNRFSRLSIPNVKNLKSPTSSPISQVIPKFFQKPMSSASGSSSASPGSSSPSFSFKNQKLSKISSSDSQGSLAFINDGSGLHVDDNIPQLPPTNLDGIKEVSSRFNSTISLSKSEIIGNIANNTSFNSDSKESLFDKNGNDTTFLTDRSSKRMSNGIESLIGEVKKEDFLSSTEKVDECNDTKI